MKKKFSILNTNLAFIAIEIVLTWGIASYWYEVSNILIGLFGMENGETIPNQQSFKGILFLINTILLFLVVFSVFQFKGSHPIFKIISIIILIIWFGIMFVHKASFGIVF